MKKILIILNALLLGIIVFMSCNKRDTLAPVAVSRLCNPCTDHTSTPFTGITGNLAKSMFTDYKTYNQPLLQIDDATPDANRIWFSLEALKNFIWKVEQEVCRHPCADRLKLGIRIYYARYPGDMNVDGLSTLPDSYAKHHTLFMVPTYQDAVNSNIQWDFDPYHWGNNNCKPTPIAELLRGSSTSTSGLGAQKFMIFSIGGPQYYRGADGTLTDWTAMNHGNMAPPPPPGGIDGSGLD
jgi:hypothetical protein